MEKVFDIHAHYTFEIPLEETVELFRKEFMETGTEKCCFLSLPQEVKGDKYLFDGMQNIKGLYLKRAFSPNGYAFAGLEHPFDHSDEESISKDFEKQAEKYLSVGYDGMKMLEGYPSLLKAWKTVPLDSVIYDRFYSFMEENGYPIIMHAGNPTENWDISTASLDAIRAGRVYDSSYPTKAEITAQVFGVLKKHPKLKLALAHWGFMSDEKENAERFLGEYENTIFDITPGGEQFINMQKDWEYWLRLIEKYQNRIVYGTDAYAFPCGEVESWREWFWRRPKLIRQFFETDTEHEYLGKKFCGVRLDKKIRRKIYWENAERLLAEPKKIDDNYLLKTAEGLVGTTQKSVYAETDLQYIIKTLNRS